MPDLRNPIISKMEIFSCHLDFKVQVKSCGQVVNKFDSFEWVFCFVWVLFHYSFHSCLPSIITIFKKKVYDFWQANKPWLMTHV
jgi:hypothetical protein